MLSDEQGSIKYYFLSLQYDSTWDWTQVSPAIGEPIKASQKFCNIMVVDAPQFGCSGCFWRSCEGEKPQ